jgi:hypothetical protein
MIHSLTLYLKGAKGESLTEPDDFDKELLLFKKELAGNPNKAEIVKSKEVIKNLLEESIIPFCKELEIKFQGLKELYADYKVGVAEVGSNNKWNYTLGKNCLSALDVLSAVPNSNEKNIVFQFLEFKTIKRSFSIELKLIIDFDTFKYSISHTIMIDNTLTSGGNITYKDSKDLTSKAYSQNLTNEDVLKLVSNIARNVLKLTKEEYIGHKL